MSDEARCPVTGMKAGDKPGFFTRLYLKFFHKKARYN